MSKILLKLVDNALLPASLITLAKVGGVIIGEALLGTSTSFYALFLPRTTILTDTSQTQIIAQNSFSDFLMYAAAFAGCAVLLVKMIYFHQSHIKPKFILHLAHTNLLHVIQESFDLYATAFIWFFFLYAITIYLIIASLMGDISPKLAAGVSAISIILGYILIKDIEFEIENAQKKKINMRKHKVI